VGADRKGPLAAFVVIAIIAAVLLVTSVRSQAEPGRRGPEQLTTAASTGSSGQRDVRLATRGRSAGRAVPLRRGMTSASRGAARDAPDARGGAVDWAGWLARLWVRTPASDYEPGEPGERDGPDWVAVSRRRPGSW
jgi:hypothetical protein